MTKAKDIWWTTKKTIGGVMISQGKTCSLYTVHQNRHSTGSLRAVHQYLINSTTTSKFFTFVLQICHIGKFKVFSVSSDSLIFFSNDVIFVLKMVMIMKIKLEDNRVD